ncbi:MAG: phosphomannomutase/phosphoglucomutase [Actinomycetes bacterium]
MRNLSAIVKAYDIRGVVPDQWDVDEARALGAAYAQILESERVGDSRRALVLGRDMRPSSQWLGDAFAHGVCSQGWDVIDIGLASTDGLYFASGSMDLPGAMFTASHNPQEYNGIKLCRAGATPVGQDTGLAAIRDLAQNGPPSFDGPLGELSTLDVLSDYASYLLNLVPINPARELTVVVDAGNGMAGLTVPAVLNSPHLKVIEMYFDLDGTFPHHEANPIEPANLVDLQAKVLEVGADIGLAFDGDADRCFVVDERGLAVSPSALTALIADRELALHPGSAIIHNLITSWSVPEVVREAGGVPVRTRVGHSFIKAEMATSGAVFGGEHSGHFYFRDFWRADSGMLAALHVLSALAQAPSDVTLSTLLSSYDRYVASGEINSTVSDQQAAIALVRAEYADSDVAIDELDGLTVAGGDWWFNLRPSNTEPLLRLNAEARDRGVMIEVRDQVLGLVREGK